MKPFSIKLSRYKPSGRADTFQSQLLSIKVLQHILQRREETRSTFRAPEFRLSPHSVRKLPAHLETFGNLDFRKHLPEGRLLAAKNV